MNLLSSCRLGAVATSFSTRVEGLCNNGVYDGVEAYSDADWHVLRDEIVKYVDEKGLIYYYFPISVSTTLTDQPYLSYLYGDWSSRHLLDTRCSLGGGERMKAEPAKQVYAHLDMPSNEKDARRILVALNLPHSKQDIEKLSSFGKSYDIDAKHKEYKEVSRITVPRLEAKLRALDYKVSGWKYNTETNLTGKIAGTTTHIVVDIPLTIAGITGGMLYANTVGFVFSLFENDEDAEE